MENFTRFGFSPFSEGPDNSSDTLSHTDRLAESESDLPKLNGHDGVDLKYTLMPGISGFTQFLQDSDMCSASSPSTTVDSSDISSIDTRSSINDPQDSDVASEGSTFNSNGKRRNSATNEKKEPKKRRTITGNYTRHVDKPPYSYQGLIVTAIMNSPNQELTLRGVHSWMRENFEFFRGNYTGWKDSIRHNLSSSKCFYRETRKPLPMQPKRPQNYWKVNLTLINEEVFRLQPNPLGKTGLFAPYIHEELGLPPIQLPPKTENDAEQQIPKKQDVIKSKPTKILKSDNLNVKLPTTLRQQSTSVVESPEFLRHSRSTDNKIDTPTPARNGTSQSAEKVPPPEKSSMTERETTQMTPTIHVNDIFSYLRNTAKDIPNPDAVQDVVRNLSLLCDSSKDRPDLNASFNDRKEAKCLENSPALEEFSPDCDNARSPTTPVNVNHCTFQESRDFIGSRKTADLFYPEFHQVSACDGQNFSSVYTSAASNLFRHQEPLFQPYRPVVCYYQTPTLSSYHSDLHYASPVFPVVTTAHSHARYPVFFSRHEHVQRPSSNSPDVEEGDFVHAILRSDRLGMKHDDERTNCMIDVSGDDRRLESVSNVFSEV